VMVEKWNCRLQSFVAIAEPVEAVLQRVGVEAPLERIRLKGLSIGKPVDFTVKPEEAWPGNLRPGGVCRHERSGARQALYLDAPWRKIDLDNAEVVSPWTPVEVTRKVSLWGPSYTSNQRRCRLPSSVKGRNCSPEACGYGRNSRRARGVSEGKTPVKAKDPGGLCGLPGRCPAGRLAPHDVCELEYDGRRCWTSDCQERTG